MNITTFDDLLLAAHHQTEPQRLLLVFASTELPADSTPEQAARFEAGQGGALAPLMCVDKTPVEIDSFASLAAEAQQFGQPWSLVFAAAMVDGPDAEAPLQRVVEDIKRGAIGNYLPFNLRGEAVRLG
uniref:ribonucleotide reductase subunit alpha n=1 Tax=Hylemonella sp. TaxID=2066020 RepID=UPI0035AE960B